MIFGGIKDCYEEKGKYLLGLPTQEVAESFSKALMPLYSGHKETDCNRTFLDMRDALIDGDTDLFMNMLKTFLTGNPYGNTRMAERESYFKNNLYIILRALGFKPRTKEETCWSWMNVQLETRRFIYIFELKTDGSVAKAMLQIEEREYAELDRPSKMVQTLDSLAHNLDPSRMTMGASNQNDDFNGFTDMVAFNKYFGWYDGEPSELGIWLDGEHTKHPERKIGMSEYGAGGNTLQQSEELIKPEPWGHWHPENWQTDYHVKSYRQLADRDWLWCNFIWCMFDFCAAGRNEGDTPGRNDKGLVSYDRKNRKDAFYFYKANWNKEELFVHIAGKRQPRSGDTTTIMAFSNDGEGELYINGKKYGKATPDNVNVLLWEDVPVAPDTKIEVRTRHSSDSFSIR